MGLLLLLPRWGPLLFLLGGCFGCSSHSMHYLCTGVSGPSQGLPSFIAVGYVDDQPIVKYDSETEKTVHQVSWILKAGKDNAQYWEKITQEFLKLDMKFSQYLLNLQDQYNQSKGFHTLQLMYGCELSPDGHKEGYYRYGYDGRDFLTFDKETLTWTAADTEARVTERKWHPNLDQNQHYKRYLEEECIEWLQRYLDYGNETLLRTELPVGKVTRQALPDSQESLICQAYGFYPREINTTWRKDGEVMEHATFRRDVAPNSNGTYHAWLSINVDPQDRNRYYCHIEHASLTKPLVLAWEEPAKVGHPLANLGIVLWGLAAVLAVAAVAAGIFLVLKKVRKEAACERTSASSQEPASSTSSFFVDIEASTEKEMRKDLQRGRPASNHFPLSNTCLSQWGEASRLTGSSGLL
ncbi:major histocompatibility complex class I-related gene protein-like [Zootoca vivipara]|uniref:major histocompatibility complex class I-related gene protein-like n=1 Tax=Zootoca vivipara TaxID=8524 RepID=UPI00293C0A38|nr:major histocompatibility complex class I-related gene protein-like [Zootoca vivipara]